MKTDFFRSVNLSNISSLLAERISCKVYFLIVCVISFAITVYDTFIDHNEKSKNILRVKNKIKAEEDRQTKVHNEVCNVCNIDDVVFNNIVTLADLNHYELEKFKPEEVNILHAKKAKIDRLKEDISKIRKEITEIVEIDVQEKLRILQSAERLNLKIGGCDSVFIDSRGIVYSMKILVDSSGIPYCKK